MTRRPNRYAALRAAAAISTSGVLLATSCSISEVQAIVAGVEAVARAVDDPSTGNLVDFGVFLVAELID